MPLALCQLPGMGNDVILERHTIHTAGVIGQVGFPDHPLPIHGQIAVMVFLDVGIRQGDHLVPEHGLIIIPVKDHRPCPDLPRQAKDMTRQRTRLFRRGPENQLQPDRVISFEIGAGQIRGLRHAHEGEMNAGHRSDLAAKAPQRSELLFAGIGPPVADQQHVAGGLGRKTRRQTGDPLPGLAAGEILFGLTPLAQEIGRNTCLGHFMYRPCPS